jgi:2-succinyl-6-hydroxy-2,4-cyclohexadiene-1-carboxylate synthase
MIWTLSGFLGLPSDWDFVPWPHRSLLPPDGGEPAAADVIIGYSMGGRIALRLLESRTFSSAVIISAGLNTPDEARRLRDETWATRFLHDDWATLMRDWNAQSVFGGHELERREKDYDRAELARQISEWSPAVLHPPRLESIETPILWVAGERDAKFADVAGSAVDRLPRAELWLCPDAGHRVLWEQPRALVARLRRFLDLH